MSLGRSFFRILEMPFFNKTLKSFRQAGVEETAFIMEVLNVMNVDAVQKSKPSETQLGDTSTDSADNIKSHIGALRRLQQELKHFFIFRNGLQRSVGKWFMKKHSSVGDIVGRKSFVGNRL